METRTVEYVLENERLKAKLEAEEFGGRNLSKQNDSLRAELAAQRAALQGLVEALKRVLRDWQDRADHQGAQSVIEANAALDNAEKLK